MFHDDLLTSLIYWQSLGREGVASSHDLVWPNGDEKLAEYELFRQNLAGCSHGS